MQIFRYVAGLIIVVMSLLVCFFNGKVAFRMKKEIESFHKICVNKAIANVFIGLAFLIWCAPSAFLGFTYLPHQFNVFFGEFAGWAPYLMSGPFTQISLAINRSMAINFPYRFNRPNTFSVTKLALISWWILAILVSIPSFMDGCGFIFYAEFVSWGPMETPCSQHLSEYVTYYVGINSICSFSINAFSIFKVLSNSGIQQLDQTSALRKSRRRKMFIQCVIQDCTHSIDTITTTFLYDSIDSIWFRFYCGTISELLITLLDGVLMSILHQKSSTPERVTEKSSKNVQRIVSVVMTNVV